MEVALCIQRVKKPNTDVDEPVETFPKGKGGKESCDWGGRQSGRFFYVGGQ
jgi:hypothetical protein